MDFEENIKRGIEENKKIIDKFCNEFNKKRKYELEKTIEELKEKIERLSSYCDLSKIKPSKYPNCYCCWFKEVEDKNEKF